MPEFFKSDENLCRTEYADILLLSLSIIPKYRAATCIGFDSYALMNSLPLFSKLSNKLSQTQVVHNIWAI